MTLRRRLVGEFERWRHTHRVRAGGGRIDKKAICRWYEQQIVGAATCEDLASLRHYWPGLRDALGKPQASANFGRALQKALHDIDRGLDKRVCRLRTTGELWVNAPPDASLDATESDPSVRVVAREPSGYEPQPALAVRLDGVAEGKTVKLPVELRAGARVTVLVSREDVVEASETSRIFPWELLEKLEGSVSYGGDALVDSERWEGLD